MANASTEISPGVYTNVVDLTDYASSVSGTVGFVPVITEKGKDNELVRITSYQDYIEQFGEPDIRTFGKYYGCGPYIATQHLSVSSDLYVLRALPDDATYAHTFIYFSQVDDYPYAYKFAQRYQDQICDAGKVDNIKLYAIADGTKTTITAKQEAAIAASCAYGKNEDGSANIRVNKPEQVLWTSVTKYAQQPDDATLLYLLKTDRSEDVKTAIKALIVAGTAYDNDNKVVTMAGDEPTDEECLLATRTSDSTSTAVADTTADDFIGGTYECVAYATEEWEPTSSNGDYNVGYTKSQYGGDPASWYLGKHTGLSAFSVIPGLVYAIQSDVTCYQQTVSTAVGALQITTDADLKANAINERCAYDADGLIVYNTDTDAATKAVYTSAVHPEYALKYKKVATDKQTDAFNTDKGYSSKFVLINHLAEGAQATDVVYVLASETTLADPSSSEYTNGNNEVTLQVARYEVDPLPWYVIDQSKKDEAIEAYDAYDQYGFLTNDSNKAKYCAYSSHANEIVDPTDPTKKIKEQETTVALLRPLTTKFEVDAENMTYTMNRSSKTFEANALVAIKKCAAWDQNGYPALSVDKVYVTSIEDYAVTAKAPKMSNTQKLDSLFYGNDTLTLGCIKNLGELQPAIYSTNKRIPSKCILGSVRAVGRGNYYNTYSIKITSDANPQQFGTYKFHVYELQDGEEVLAETFNVSFDPTALDGDGESLYFVDVINKFSTRIVVTANENAVDLFASEMKAFYMNDPTITDLTTDYVYVDVNDKGETDIEHDGEQYPFNTAMIPQFYIEDETDERYDKIINADMLGMTGNDNAAQIIFNTLSKNIASKAYGYKAKAIWEAYYAKAWAEKYTFDAAKAYNAALELDDSDETKASALDEAIEMMNVAQDMTSDASEMYTWATSLNLMNMSDCDSISAGQQPYYLENGSLGGLINEKGVVNSTIGNQILAQAYTGLLKKPVIVKHVDETTGSISYKQKYTDDVYNTEWIYFSLVYDPGYKPDVKQAALDLVDTYRRDCVLISDCCDNADCEDCLKYVGAVLGGSDVRSWNTYLAARYESYSRVYDSFTGKDIWVSPVYHMAKMIPSVDVNHGMQYAAAGFNRGTISAIKELRYSPNKSQRDLLYQAQVNPIVYFPEGMTMWGQLTTQKKQSVLSDLNSVRVMLYIKRALEQYCRNYIFELNESSTWTSTNKKCSSFLSQMVSDNMIENYSIEVGATDYELKTKICHVNVTLTMKKTLEKIQLNLYVQ